ncbi:MAG: helix-turn-helix transcriptional regulator [Duncaniella sp.]|nr:helix-turn-helix transcriptional regulator [Duncaniella sp.]
MAVSISTLTRLTRSIMGITPGEFLSKARIRKAKIYLKNDRNLQIAEIAQLCGYSAPKYFSRCFKAECGMSPSQYRNIHID